MMMKKLSFNLVLLMLTFGLAACGSVNVDEYLPDKKVEYKRERQAEKNLEIPPDLTSDRINDRMSVPDTFGGVSTSYTEFVTDRKLRDADGGPRSAVGGSVLPNIQDVEVRRDGDVRWLLVNATVEDVWPRVIDFWQENGILMAEEDPTVGIMRTSCWKIAPRSAAISSRIPSGLSSTAFMRPAPAISIASGLSAPTAT